MPSHNYKVEPHLLAMFECEKCRRRLTNIGGRCDYKDCEEVEKELIDKQDAFMKALTEPHHRPENTD